MLKWIGFFFITLLVMVFYGVLLMRVTVELNPLEGYSDTAAFVLVSAGFSVAATIVAAITLSSRDRNRRDGDDGTV